MVSVPGKQKLVKFQTLTHHGHVSAAALLFDFALVDEVTAKRRILSEWSAGSRVFQLDGGLLLTLPVPKGTRSDSSYGLPLVEHVSEHGTHLIAMPLTRKDIDALRPPSRSVIRLKHGFAKIERPGAEVDPSDWIDVASYEVLPVQKLSIEETDANDPLLKEENFDSRGSLTGETEPAKELIEFLDDLVEQKKGSSQSSRQSDREQPFVSSWLAELIDRLRGVDRQSRSGTEENRSSNLGEQPGISLDTKMGFFRLLQNSGLIEIFVERQQQYMLKMIDLFERGDWSKALRHGIPLGKKGDKTGGPSFGVPVPRSNIDISMERESAAESLLFSDPELHDRLKRLYRKSVEHLTKAGRFKDAAFVLADLLGESEEAVSYLERHGEFMLAAQLAESRRLSPPIVVRQWFIAGDTKRAIMIARLTGCFAEAVRILETDHPDLANALRTFWASHLAASGQYTEAALVAMKIPGMEHLALEWTRLAVQSCDSQSGQLLALWLTRLEPQDWFLIKGHIARLLDDESRELAPARMAFASNLASTTPEALVMARQAARSLLRDHGYGYVSVGKRLLKTLTILSGDEALRTDAMRCSLTLPKLNLLEREERLKLELSEGDTGTDHLYDAVFLADGRTVAALGESGMVVVDGSGRLIKHLATPVYDFVLSKGQDRLLALAWRGESVRVSRVDLLNLSVEDLGDAIISVFANNFDGSTWCTAYKDEVYVVDTTQSRYRVLWQMPGVHHRVASIVCDDSSCSIATVSTLVDDCDSTELLEMKEIHYCESPGLNLRRIYRASGSILDLYGNEIHPGRHYSTPAGEQVSFGLSKDKRFVVNAMAVQLGASQSQVIPCESILEETMRSAVTNDYTAICFAQMHDESSRQTNATCFLISTKEGKILAQIEFAGAQILKPRLQEHCLTLCDDRGRIVAIDLKDGTQLRNLRI